MNNEKYQLYELAFFISLLSICLYSCGNSCYKIPRITSLSGKATKWGYPMDGNPRPCVTEGVAP